MKSEVETLSPTRVKLTVEVPFEELAPSVDAAYRKVAGQIRIPGFRPGKVPARIVDQRIGRDVVLDEAVNDAIPQFYGQAVEAADVRVLSQPEIEVTNFADGEQLTFTAEVDVRPAIELPELTNLPVTVDDAEVTDADVDEQLKSLADRFGTLTSVERPVEAGDFVSIDLSLSVDGEAARRRHRQRAVVRGRQRGPDRRPRLCAARLVGGGVGGVRHRARGPWRDGGRRPDARQSRFAACARSSCRRSTTPSPRRPASSTPSTNCAPTCAPGSNGSRRLEQGMQARDNVLEALLGKVEIPLPERTVEDEIRNRRDSLEQQLAANGLDLDAYLLSQDETLEAHEAHTKVDVERDLRAQFVLDAVVVQEELGIEEAELTEYIVRRASRAGVSPDDYAQQLVRSGTVPLAVADVLRGKALAYVLENAVVTDASGRTVDLNRLEQDVAAGSS